MVSRLENENPDAAMMAGAVRALGGGEGGGRSGVDTPVGGEGVEMARWGGEVLVGMLDVTCRYLRLLVFRPFWGGSVGGGLRVLREVFFLSRTPFFFQGPFGTRTANADPVCARITN